MGWTYVERPAGKSLKDFFSERFSWENAATRQELAGCAVVALRTAYLAVSQTEKATGKTTTNAVVCLLDYAPRDLFNQGFKDVEESMGPVEDACPEKILALLSPVEEIYGEGPARDRASAWRRRCRERIDRARKRPRLATGRFVLFEEPVRFANGERRALFFVKDARRRVFTDSPNRHAVRYRIPGGLFVDRPYRIIDAPTEERAPCGTRPEPEPQPAQGRDAHSPRLFA